MNAPASPSPTAPPPAGRTWVAAFAGLTLLLLAAGWWFYRSEARSIRAHRHEELAAIGALKAGQIQSWRRERLNDATRMAGGPLVRKAVAEFLREPGGPLRADLLERLRIERTAGGYADALIFAPDGKLLLAANDAPEPLAPATRQLLAAALASQEAVLSDFFRHADEVVHIEAAAVVRDAAGQPLAVAVLRSDAAAFLYPMIQSWPTPSRSGETFIVQREGDFVVWLNEARHQTNTALALRQPVTRTEIPGVQAALGRKGIFEGVDYRGHAVLADLRAVAGSPWFMVAKVDQVEIFAELRARTGLIALVVGSLILMAAAGTAFLYRQKHAGEVVRFNAYNRSLIEASLDPLVTISAEGKITDVNEASVQATGVPREQLIGTDFSTCFTAPEQARAGYRQVFSEGFVRDYPLAIRHTSGRITEVLYNASVYRDAQGQVLGVFAAARDITGLRRAEEALRQLNADLERRVRERTAELQAANESLHTEIATRKQAEGSLAVNLAAMTHLQQLGAICVHERELKPVLVAIVDAAIAIGGANFGNLQLLDAATGELRIAAHRGFPQWWLDHWDAVSRGHGSCGTALAHGERVIVEDVEHSPVFTGEALAVQLRADVRAVQSTPLVTRSGRAVGMFSTHWRFPHRPDERTLRMLDLLARQAADLIERAQAEATSLQLNEALQQRTAELTAANQELESFSYAVSHDLRAPLRAMCGFSQALVEDYGATLQGEARVYLEQIIRASRHMGELVDGLLALSRCTRGELRREPIDLTALCERIRDELARAEPERRVEWQIQPGLVARGDPRMIEVVMNNLLGNAWKYTARQAAPVIRVHAGPADGRPCFCVTDNGAGFDMKHAEQLFKPFQRLHRQEEFPGTGIGLATVQRILHRHGGTIHATAAVGQGATFTFSLPEPDTPNPPGL